MCDIIVTRSRLPRTLDYTIRRIYRMKKDEKTLPNDIKLFRKTHQHGIIGTIGREGKKKKWKDNRAYYYCCTSQVAAAVIIDSVQRLSW